jgi:RHS repeat-associated protein
MVRGSLYGGGMHLADYTAGTGSGGGQTEFRFMDEVNSLAIKIDQAGDVLESCYQNPFGESLDCDDANSSSIPTDFTETHFTDKKRDAESGLDYFGARYYASNLSRFMSPDPQGPTPLHLLNPQRWNMYGYGLNNPLSYTDSGGRDAAAVNFSKEIAIVGHEGIMSVTSDGTVRYARFGPAGGSALRGVGQVQSFTLNTKVQFDSSGNPTANSLNAVKQELSTTGPEKGQDPSSIKLNYFKTTDEETANLNQWIDQQQAASNQGKSSRYNVLTNNCADFCLRGLVAGDALTQSQANHMSFVPNRLYFNLNQLQLQEPKASVTTSECDALPGGGQNCY